MVLADGDRVAVDGNMSLSDVRNPLVAPIVVSLGDGEGNKAIQVPAGLRDDIFTRALEVKVVTVERVVVRVAPGPAGACVQWLAHCFTLHNAALLLEPTLDILAWIFSETNTGGRNEDDLTYVSLFKCTSVGSCQFCCLACVVASHNSFPDQAFGPSGAGMFFTDETFVWLAGTFFPTLFFENHLPGLQTQCRGIAMRANVHIILHPPIISTVMQRS